MDCILSVPIMSKFYFHQRLWHAKNKAIVQKANKQKQTKESF